MLWYEQQWDNISCNSRMYYTNGRFAERRRQVQNQKELGKAAIEIDLTYEGIATAMICT
ncbi:MAG: hypothetical protein HQ589_02470, partial [Syntrophaceae bacterium]|nr:hypothetical protein [Syntrophaceae bacterium]